VKEVLPEVAFEDSQGMQSIAYSSIIPVLIEAIKEQQKVIEKLNGELSEIRDLKTELANLRESVGILKNTTRMIC
jgi:hypothetical protein